MYDASNQLIDGKTPYKEVFLLYGLTVAYINQLILTIFGNNLYYLIIFTSAIYSLSLYLLYIFSNNFVSKKSSFFIIFSIFFIHPWPSTPWSNYLFFLILLIGLILIFSFKKKNFYFAGILFALASFIREGVFYFIIIFFFSIILLRVININATYSKQFNYQNIIKLIATFFTIKLTFFIYIYFGELYDHYLIHQKLPFIFLEARNYELSYLFFRLIKYIFFISFSDLIFNSYKFVFALNLILNIFLLFYVVSKYIKKKKLDTKFYLLFSISILTCLLYGLSVHEVQVFRLVCGSTIGFITIYYFIENIKNKKIRIYLMNLFLLISIFCLSPFYKNQNNLIYTSFLQINETKTPKVKFLKNFRFKKDTTNNLNYVNNLFFDLNNKCKVRNFVNLQKDIYFKIIGDEFFNNIQFIPWYKNHHQENTFIKYFDKNLHLTVQKFINQNDLIVITTPDMVKKLEINNNKINIENYTYKIVEYSYDQKNLVIFAPSRCDVYF